MRVLRDRGECVCATLPSCPPTTQHSLEDVGKLWAEWGIHFMILVSFGLQVFLSSFSQKKKVFLFFAAGLRRRSASLILRSLIWLAYMSADSVAIFILGHLSIHATGPHHQLLFFWAPFVLIHLGGQHTITAFSMKDNELWRRRLLGLVTQVVMVGYVVSRSSWPDKRLRAAMVLMFLSGCLRYGGRILCLYRASPEKLKEYSLGALRCYVGSQTWNYDSILSAMLEADGRHSSFFRLHEISSSADVALVSDTPLSDLATTEAGPSYIQGKLEEFKSKPNCYRAYNYVNTRLVHIYELLYTKATLHYFIGHKLFRLLQCCSDICECGEFCHSLCSSFLLPTFRNLFHFLALSLLVLFPFLSTLAILALFVVAKKSQLYSQVDIIVTYTLLIGAVTLEIASLFIVCALSLDVPCRILSVIFGVDKCIHPTCGPKHTKQWSCMLGQYNMINSLTKQDATCTMSFVLRWINKRLDDKAVTHMPIYEDLKKFVLDKLLEFGTRREDWNFASFRGQLALRDWKSSHGFSSVAETSLHKSINDEDFPTTVLMWHIATDILYLQDHTNSPNSYQQTKKISRELSNYMMYLVFKCDVMLTNTNELQHNNALKDMKAHRGLGEEHAMNAVFQENELRMSTPGNLITPLLPRACKVARELINIQREANCWDLIVAVWLEMLYYIAPRCGGAFHSEHLATGGEFITHVLLLMHFLGPFLKPQGIPRNAVLSSSRSDGVPSIQLQNQV